MDRTHKLMLEATRTRGRLRMVYGGKPRVVEPQCFGMACKGTQLLQMHQLNGGTELEPLFDLVEDREPWPCFTRRFRRPALTARITSGLVFYTYGEAAGAGKPSQETGIAMQAATGNVNTQSQSGATRLTANRKVEVFSTGGMVRVTAPEHILLTAAGAAIDIQSSSITLKGPGKIAFKTSMKELTGPGKASLPTINFPRADLNIKKTTKFLISL